MLVYVVEVQTGTVFVGGGGGGGVIIGFVSEPEDPPPPQPDNKTIDKKTLSLIAYSEIAPLISNSFMKPHIVEAASMS